MRIESPPSVSVVLPNYNGAELLKANLPPLLVALQVAGCEWEIVVSDDASTDTSVVMLQKEFPQVQVLTHPFNTGFAATVNRGISACKHTLVLLLNTDVVLFPDYLLACFPYFDDASTFGVMGKIINLENDDLQDAAKYPAGNGVKLTTTLNYTPVGPDIHTFRWPSLFLSGANALISREKLTLLGGMEELFSPFYVEDAELCLRAWRLGWRCYYAPGAICRHPASTTIKAYHKQKKIDTISVRNRAFLHYLHLSGIELVRFQIGLLLKLLLAVLLFKTADRDGIIASYRQLDALKKSKMNFDALAKKLGLAPLSLVQVRNQLNRELKGHAIRKF
jgi:GT2 family glycosyltransferase